MKINNVNQPVTAVRKSQYPEDNKPEILLVGRSNVGKSSFINCLINRKNFARTSSTPGKTRTLNFYLVNDDFYLVDVPGYGYAKVSKQLKHKFGMIIEDYLEGRDNLVHVFMLIDFRHKPTNDDIMMFEFLKYYNISLTIIATKTDKVKTSAIEKNKKIILDTFNIENDELILFSAPKKTGRETVLKKLANMLEK